MPTEIEVIEGQIPGLARLVDFISRFVQNDFALRRIQSANAPRALYGQQIAVTDLIPFLLPQAVAENTAFSFLVIVLDVTSGEGRYVLDGSQPSTTRGIEVPAGGQVIYIEGSDNIKNFRLIAKTGQALAGCAQPFQ